MNTTNTLDILREDINAVDSKILSLLEARVDLARKIACVKNKKGLSKTDATREQDILLRLQPQTSSPLVRDSIQDIWQVLFTLSKKIRTWESAPRCPFKKVGIIGDGLIGRSICLALQARGDTEVVIRNHNWTLRDFDTCECIVIATPIEAVEPVAERLIKLKGRSRLILDVASLKEQISNIFNKLNRLNRHVFIPTHPMAGGIHKGNVHAESSLFVGRSWVLCDIPTIDKRHIEPVESFILSVGAHTIHLDPKTHDEHATFVSHVPALLSKTLYEFVSRNCPEAQEMAGPGFARMTKSAQSDNIRMYDQIFRGNRHNIETVLKWFVRFVIARSLK